MRVCSLAIWYKGFDYYDHSAQNKTNRNFKREILMTIISFKSSAYIIEEVGGLALWYIKCKNSNASRRSSYAAHKSILYSVFIVITTHGLLLNTRLATIGKQTSFQRVHYLTQHLKKSACFFVLRNSWLTNPWV